MASVEVSSLEMLEEALASGDVAALESLLESLNPADITYAVAHLEEHDQSRLLTLLSPAAAAHVIEVIPEAAVARAVAALPAESAAAIVHELPSDEQADLLSAIDEDDVNAILALLPPEEAEDVRALSRHQADEAGGLMVTEYLAYPQGLTCADVVDDLRKHAEDYARYNVQYIYIIDEEERLTGVARLRDLVLRSGNTPLSRILLRDPHSMKVDAPLQELESFFDEHRFFGVPVVDEAGVLLGVVQRDAVEEALAEKSGSDLLRSRGIVGGEELRTMPLFTRSRRRLGWLSINIVLNIIAASVIAVFQDTLEAVITLAVFLPIISDMSGCSGNQAVAVSMRELSLNLVRPAEMFRVWLKEITVGMINGTVLGCLVAIAGYLYGGNAWLGLVVGVALAINTMIAVSIGGTVPLLLRRLKKDPALASGPILTTVTDMCGFFLVLGLATLLLSKLTTGT
ncbi:MAG: magnesium transporter [Phycisphaerales bacterium]